MRSQEVATVRAEVERLEAEAMALDAAHTAALVLLIPKAEAEALREALEKRLDAAAERAAGLEGKLARAAVRSAQLEADAGNVPTAAEMRGVEAELAKAKADLGATSKDYDRSVAGHSLAFRRPFAAIHHRFCCHRQVPRDGTQADGRAGHPAEGEGWAG